MFYRKNLYSWEQIARVLLSLAVVAYGFFFMPAGIISMAVMVGGVAFALTGVFGWCPACAMVGRKLKS